MQLTEIVNWYGLALAVVLNKTASFYGVMVCNSVAPSAAESGCSNRAMLTLDRMGRFGSLFLLSFHLGVLEKGFTQPKELMQQFWMIATAVLAAAYLLLRVVFSKREKKQIAILIVASSAAVVILSGILQVNTLLLTAGIVYLIGELYIVKCKF